MSADSPNPLETLFAAARAEPLDTARAEWGFETRLQARLREEGGASIDAWAWRLCPFFAALAVAAAFWSRTANVRFDQDAAVLTEAARGSDETVLMARFTGGER